MTNIEFAALKKYGELIKQLFGIDYRVYDLDKPEDVTKALSFSCQGCDVSVGECQNSHLRYINTSGLGLGCNQYVCSKGLSFINIDFYTRSVPIGYIIFGPVQLSYSGLVASPGVPLLSVTQYNTLQNLLREIVLLYNTSSYSTSTDLSVDVLPSVSFRPIIEGYSHYNLKLEKQILKMVSNGLDDQVVSSIPDLVANLFSVTGDDASEVRKRVEEISLLIARSTIKSNADLPSVFHEMNKFHSQIKTLKEEDDFVDYLIHVVDLMASLTSKNDKSSPKESIVIRRLHNFIMAHYGEKISLEQAAKYCQVSQSHLGNILNSSLGYTFTQYVNFIRVEKGKEMLSNTDCDVCKIAEQCGFNGQSYFTQVFKSFTGVNPLDFRKESQAASMKKYRKKK